MRCIDSSSVKEADKVLSKWVFCNYDYDADKPLITPHGPDPVLAGIRGEDPGKLLEFLSMLRICEPTEGYMVFRTNQGTDAHYVLRSIASVRPYQTCCVYGYVSEVRVVSGGDVLIKLCYSSSCLWVVIFRELGLGGIARSLVSGDFVIACGSTKYWSGLGTVLHVEKFSVEPIELEIRLNPRCPRCGKRMKSAGRGKGWKCPRCGFRSSELPYEYLRIDRSWLKGHYVPRDSVLKHLTKPRSRYGREGLCVESEPKGPWFL